MRPLTISQLEKATGVGRSTIYYYIGEGLLPPGQKASATRAVYDRTHVDLLNEITRLKAGGMSLKQVRDALADTIKAATDNGVDLVARQNESTRNAILQVAARRFAERGYDRTRISDICREVGVTAQLLYTHFPSKRHLFIECYTVYYEWMHAQVQSSIAETSDAAARLAWRAFASYGIQAFSPDLQALARVEAFQPESDLRPLVRELYERILEEALGELATGRDETVNQGLFDDELVSYALLGALENMQMRASWDDEFSKRDVIRNLLVMFMAVRAAYAGRVDLSGEWAVLEGLVDRLAGAIPERGWPLGGSPAGT